MAHKHWQEDNLAVAPAAGICYSFPSRSFSPTPHSTRAGTQEVAGQNGAALDRQCSDSIEVTVVQLLPDFDGSLDDLTLEEPVHYTDEDLEGLQTGVTIENNGNSLLHDEPSLANNGFIPPCVLQKIAECSDSMTSGSPPSSLDDRFFHPVLLRSSGSLSVTREGFIQLGDYKVSFDSMGGGKLSEVRIAFNEKDSTHYAVKILSKKKLRNYKMLLRSSRNPLEEAYREISILKRLDHPNILKIKEVIDEPDNDDMYIITELLGQPIMDLPSADPFTEEVAKDYFRQIVDAVDHLHKNSIVHRDLKPENILLSRDGKTIKIADFGFSDDINREVNEGESSESESETQPELSDEEVSPLHGTPAFTSPECLRHHKKPVSG